MSVPYDYYRIFYFVAKYGSFTRAAQVLMNSQPNITRAMNNLERELDCHLFLRSRRGVSLTPEGEKLYAHVQIAQAHLAAGESELLSSRDLQNGSISIGASETAFYECLLPALRRFHNAYPNVQIRITNDSTPQALAHIKSGLVEFAVVVTPTGVTRPLKAFPLMNFTNVLIGGPRYFHLAGQTLSLKELADGYPLIALGKDTLTFEFFDCFFRQHGCEFHPSTETATIDQILPLVKYDLGLGFLSRTLVKEALDHQEVCEIRLAEALPAREICLVRDIDRPLNPAARELERILRDSAQGLSDKSP